MAQLKMYRLKKTPERVELAPGYTWRIFNNTDEDIDAWVRVCKNGLLKEDADRGDFCSRMTQRAYFKPDDIFFIEKDSVPVATITAITETGNNNTGYVHMVAASPECRGKGIGNFMNYLALCRFEENGCPISYLTTDEFRVPAVKSYLTAGFLPVLYDDEEEMERRWASMLKLFGIPEIDALDNDGNFAKKIKAEA